MGIGINYQDNLASLNVNQNLGQAKRLSKTLATSKDDRKLQQSCEDFETVFINMLLKQMRRTVPESEFMGNSREEKIYREMLDEKISAEMAKGKQLGIAKMLYNQLKVKSK